MGRNALRFSQSPLLANNWVCCYAHNVGVDWKCSRSWTAKSEWMLDEEFFPPCSSDIWYILQLGWKRHCWQHDFPLLWPPEPEHNWTTRTISPVCYTACLFISRYHNSCFPPENIRVGNVFLQLMFSIWTWTYWYFSSSLKYSLDEDTGR